MYLCSAYLSMRSPAVLRYSQQGWHPIDFYLPKACCNACPLSGSSLLIFSGFKGHARFVVLLFVSAPGHHLYRHLAFPSRDRMKASSADTLGAGLSDLKLSARTENWIPSGEYFATSSDHSNLHFLGLCWRLFKSGTLVVLGIFFSTASFFFSLFFFCVFLF